MRIFLQRDLPQLGIGVSANAMRRFWTMHAHYHGQVGKRQEPRSAKRVGSVLSMGASVGLQVQDDEGLGVLHLVENPIQERCGVQIFPAP